jgi:hypothetical protein
LIDVLGWILSERVWALVALVDLQPAVSGSRRAAKHKALR